MKNFVNAKFAALVAVITTFAILGGGRGPGHLPLPGGGGGGGGGC